MPDLTMHTTLRPGSCGRGLRRWLLIATALIPAAGHCAEVELTVSGHYARGFEFSEFIPCGSERGWWFSGNEEFDRRYYAVVGEPIDPRGPPTTVYVRATGVRTGPAAYGHMGAWKYKFRVIKVLDVRTPTARDCAQ